MSLKKFKLIQEYPGSPELGYTINSGNSMYYAYKPEQYPHLWEEINCDKTITTHDGVELELGEEYYWIYDYEQIKANLVSEYGIECSLNIKEKLFSTKLAAEEYLNSSICLELLDGIVEGENVIIYGVCEGSFQTSEMSSLKMYKKLHGGKTTGHISDKWKWFKYEKSRTEYITYHKPIFSLEYLFGRFGTIDVSTQNEMIDEAEIIINKTK